MIPRGRQRAGISGAAGPPSFPSAGPKGAESGSPSADRRSPLPANAPSAAARAARPPGCNLKKLDKGIKGRDFAGTDSRLLISADAPEPAGKTRKQNPGQRREPPHPSERRYLSGGRRGTLPRCVRERWAAGELLFIVRSLQQRDGRREEMKSCAPGQPEPSPPAAPIPAAGRARCGWLGLRALLPPAPPSGVPSQCHRRQPGQPAAASPAALRPAGSAARRGSAGLSRAEVTRYCCCWRRRDRHWAVGGRCRRLPFTSCRPEGARPPPPPLPAAGGWEAVAAARPARGDARNRLGSLPGSSAPARPGAGKLHISTSRGTVAQGNAAGPVGNASSFPVPELETESL